MDKTPEEIAQEAQGMNFDMAREKMMGGLDEENPADAPTSDDPNAAPVDTPQPNADAPLDAIHATDANASESDVATDNQPTDNGTPTETPPADPIDNNASPQAPVSSQIDPAAQEALQLAKTAADAVKELKAENERLKGLITEQNKTVDNTVAEIITEKPVLDTHVLTYGSEDEIAAEQARFSDAMASYTEGEVMKKMKPYMDDADNAKMNYEKSNIISKLSSHPDLVGFADMMPQMEYMIQQSPALQSDSNIEQRYVNAYLMAKGANSLNAPAPQAPVAQEPREQTPEEFLAMYKSNPEIQKLIAQERIKELEPGQQVPPHASSNTGGMNAALTIPSIPKNLNEASAETMKRFANIKG